MPIYEYTCPKCKYGFELLRPMNEANTEMYCPVRHTPSDRVLSKFACYTKNSDGIGSAMGGNSCSGCSANNCGSCGY